MQNSKLESKPLTVDGIVAISTEWFGKDHWSLLGYVGSRVDSHSPCEGVGQLGLEHLRCNPERHPIHATFRVSERAWKPSYGSRLAGFWKEDGTTDPDLQLAFHDDWDVLDDLEAAGLIEVISEANAFVSFTPAGTEVYGSLMAHKASGKNFSEFRMQTIGKGER